jgi:hypothetical protein
MRNMPNKRARGKVPISLWATKGQKAELKRRSRSSGKTVSGYILSALLGSKFERARGETDT